MGKEERVTRMRALLANAAKSSLDAVSNDILRQPLAPPVKAIRRRAMVKQLRLAAARYNLQDDVEAYLAAADRASLAGLNDNELGAISQFVGAAIERMAIGCDSPDAPPAR